MRLVARLVLAWLALGVGGAAALAADGASPSPEVSAAERVLWLRGPFGTVPSAADGGPEDGGLVTAREDPPLDAWVRNAPLRLEMGDPDASIGEWRASFLPLEGESVPIEASGTGDAGTPSSGVTLVGPSTPGRYRLEASVELATGEVATGAWTLVVPERDLPPDGLIEVPAPRLLLSASGGTVAGWAGSGCYIYLCVDVGRLPPLRMVPQLDVREGEEMTLRLSDGSGIAAWKLTLYPIVERLQPAVDQVGAELDVPVDSFRLTAPVESEWLMQAEVTYDRLRGWTHTFYRLDSRG